MEIELLEEPTTALTVTARAALALSSEQTRKDLQELVAKSANIREVKNTAGRDECHGAAMALVKARTTITKTGKAAREDAAAFQKAVIAQEKELIAITEGEETRLLALRDAWDAARAAEKAEAERIERLRIETIHIRIADIRESGVLALQCRTSDMVMALIEKMLAMKVEGFDEFTEEAEKVRHGTLVRMDEIFGTKRAEEQERARIKAEQEAEAARLAAERADIERQRKEAAEAERIAAQERAEQEAKAQAARKADEAAAQAILDAEALRLADERAAFEAEQAAARAAAQAQADELARQRAEFDAELARIAAESKAEQDKRDAALKALETPQEPAPVEAIAVTEIFNQEDGSDLLDGPAETWPQSEVVIAIAVGAVADRFNESWSDAVSRLGAIDWSAITPELLEQPA
jgi:predicted peroxiredoxin